MSEQVTISIPARTRGRFVLLEPEGPGPSPLIVGFHGYGENAETHLEMLRRIPGSAEAILVAVQGLHWFYRQRAEEVVASWMTRQDREHAIQDNIAYVRDVIQTVMEEYSLSGKLIYVGFSQGVAMAYRAAMSGGVDSHGLVLLGGDIPPEVRSQLETVAKHGGGPLPSWLSPPLPPVLLGRGERDEWYDDAKFRAELDLLKRAGVKAGGCAFAGGHEWSDEFLRAAGDFVKQVVSSSD